MTKTDLPSSPLLNDEPSGVDLLGHTKYARVFQRIIEDEKTQTPFSIGIFGRWGTGKTTLMRLLMERLSGRHTTCVWFSAWVYERENEIWAALLQSVIVQISSQLRFTEKIRFSFGLYGRGIAWDRLLLSIPEIAIRTLLIVTPLLSTAALSWLLLARPEVAAALKGAGLLGSILVGWHTARALLERVSNGFSLNVALNRPLNFEQHLGLLGQFREQFGRLISSFPKKGCRVAIFIDDLDRCAPEKALQILDATKVFLDVPGCIFIIGLDIAVAKTALEQKYPGNAAAQKEYVQKIFNLPFDLPAPSDAEIQNYVNNLGHGLPDKRCREVLLAPTDRNLRQIKRLINVYSVSWQLAALDSSSALMPVRLAKAVVIQHFFEPLFAILRERPQWLAYLEIALRNDGATSPFSDYDPVTMVVRGGTALPPAIVPFLNDSLLKSLLTMHPVGPADDDANFAGLAGHDIAPYLNASSQVPKAFVDSSLIVGAMQDSNTDYPDVGERYHVLRRLSVGGFAEIFLAQDNVDGRQVAIKRLHSTLSGDVQACDGFANEVARFASIGEHPNIIGILEGVMSDVTGVPYYVMEAFDGYSLDHLLEEGKSLAVPLWKPVFTSLFDVMVYIHDRGIIHCDVKPGNILFNDLGNVKILDFGSALFSEVSGEISRSISQGYSPPEQYNSQPIDVRADIYSMGVTIYECLTGVRPRNALDRLTDPSAAPVPPSSLSRILNKEVDSVVARMIDLDPNRRFQTTREARDLFFSAIEPILPS